MDFVSKQINFKAHQKCILIGEIGVNHNRNKNTLFKLIDAGINSGVDIIKFQRFNSTKEISTFAEKTNYQKRQSESDSQLELARNLELPDDWLIEAYEYCKKKKVGFLCTAFETESVDFISNILGCKTIKVPSPDITNIPLLEYMSKKFKGVILSTGASNLEECKRAVEIFKENELIILHCVSEYPAPVDEINLNVMKTLKNEFKVPIGFSDHTEGTLVPIIASSMGAVAVEKHFTLDKHMDGPDHLASADINEIKEISEGIQNVFFASGDGIKKPVKSELKNINLIRKGLTCSKEKISKGTSFSIDLIEIKRPVFDNSIEPFDLAKLEGKKFNKDKFFDEPILWSDFD